MKEKESERYSGAIRRLASGSRTGKLEGNAGYESATSA